MRVWVLNTISVKITWVSVHTILSVSTTGECQYLSLSVSALHESVISTHQSEHNHYRRVLVHTTLSVSTTWGCQYSLLEVNPGHHHLVLRLLWGTHLVVVQYILANFWQWDCLSITKHGLQTVLAPDSHSDPVPAFNTTISMHLFSNFCSIFALNLYREVDPIDR